MGDRTTPAQACPAPIVGREQLPGSLVGRSGALAG